jgi:aryl-alcohol dehydrogenase-like predicted oxidoreductase
MEYTTLGKTGLTVSVAGLGTGGNSRLGVQTGKTPEQSIAIVRQALDLGITFIDAAEAYGSDHLVGEALKDVPRDSFVLATKSTIRNADGPLPPEEVVRRLDESLKRLQTDYVDVLNLHGVSPHEYDYALNTLAPAMLREKEKGKIRHLGLTEAATDDPEHGVLQKAVQDPTWEVCMVAFHMMCQQARETIFPLTQKNGVGTLLMYAVRSIFSDKEYLKETLKGLADEGKIDAELAEGEPLGFLMTEGGADSVIDAAYRFVRHEPGVDVLLFGTGNPEHLKTNLASILAPPLPKPVVEKLYKLFHHLVGVGLDLPRFKN